MIADPSISEVMVNAPDNVFYERDGVIYLSNARFRDDRHIMRIAERILSPLGRRVDESSPYVDARLEDGSRVNIIIPPVAPHSPTITIRKFRTDKYTMGDLMAGGTVTPELAEFFNACIKGRLNTIVSGGTGTGKTTLLNALSAYLPATERIVTIEDPTELRLQQPHVVSLEARPPNLEGKNEVTQRDLVRNALRMRPDRILVGEVRGPEAFDMMQAMNTGHEGSITTVHANSPRDALMRVENMILMAGFDLPVRVIREQMASALHIIFHLARFVDGSRKVVAVSEISGLEGQIVTMQDLFRFHHEGVDANGHVLGSLAPTGIQPRFLDRLAEMGVKFSSDLFSPVRG
jgi:pilus assembly protein CpaF